MFAEADIEAAIMFACNCNLVWLQDKCVVRRNVSCYRCCCIVLVFVLVVLNAYADIVAKLLLIDTNFALNATKRMDRVWQKKLQPHTH
jgi:hypothetical protein